MLCFLDAGVPGSSTLGPYRVPACAVVSAWSSNGTILNDGCAPVVALMLNFPTPAYCELKLHANRRPRDVADPDFFPSDRGIQNVVQRN